MRLYEYVLQEISDVFIRKAAESTKNAALAAAKKIPYNGEPSVLRTINALKRKAYGAEKRGEDLIVRNWMAPYNLNKSPKIK